MVSSMSDCGRSAQWTVIVVTAPNRESAYAFDFGLYMTVVGCFDKIHRI